MNFRDKFFETYLEFQRVSRNSKVTAFAKYLSEKNRYGIVFSQQLVSGWLNGDFSPGQKYAPALASIMGEEIYNMLDLPQPDPDLEALTYLWPSLPEKKRQAIREDAQKYVTENETGTQPKRRPSEKHS